MWYDSSVWVFLMYILRSLCLASRPQCNVSRFLSGTVHFGVLWASWSSLSLDLEDVFYDFIKCFQCLISLVHLTQVWVIWEEGISNEIMTPSPVSKLVDYFFLLVIAMGGYKLLHGWGHLRTGGPRFFKKADWTSHRIQASKSTVYGFCFSSCLGVPALTSLHQGYTL